MSNMNTPKKQSVASYYAYSIFSKKCFTFLILLSIFCSMHAIEPEIQSSLVDENRVLSEAYELHLTSPDNPLVNSTVSINHEDAWLFFDNIKPSVVINDYRKYIFIGEDTLVPGTNGRVAIYAHGTVIMPHGSSFEPLKVFNKSNFSGDSIGLVVHTYYNSLDSMDNAIRSFKLKRGYMATFANNANGTGYSRVYIADKEDLQISELPAELDGKISFIRVFKHQWVTKKGWVAWSASEDDWANATADIEMTNSTWNYSWNDFPRTTENSEAVPQRSKLTYPGWSGINGKEDVSHLLSYNEPSHPEQHKDDNGEKALTVDQALAQMPDHLKSGLRIGSPSTTSNSWLFEYIDRCDKLNYRVDFVAIHAYWAKSPQQWYNDLKYVHERTGRPLWITEWNNGANWTTETWPDDTPDLTTDNAQKQLDDLTAILQVLDTTHFIERYSIYNWVQDRRAIILADTLTPAGKYYAANKSAMSYNGDNEFISQWNARSPVLELTNFSSDGGVGLSWEDPNSELTTQISVERKLDGAGYTEHKIFVYPNVTSFTDTIDTGVSGSISYRIKVKTVNGAEALSNEVSCYKTIGGGTLQVGDFIISDFDWKKAALSTGYSEVPVVILGPASYNNRNSIFTNRVKSVSSNNLNFHLEPWQYIEDPVLEVPENVSLLTISEGRYSFGGLSAEAGSVSGVTDEWKQVTFTEPFSSVPIVFSTQVTNNPSFPTTSRIRNVTKTGFEVCLQKEEEVTSTLLGDKVSFLAITTGVGWLDNKKIITGILDEVGDYYSYGEAEIDASFVHPAIFANLQTVNDEITSTIRYTKTAEGNVKLFKKREKSLTSAPVAKDQLAYMVVDLESSLPSSVYSQTLQNTTVFPNPVHNVLFFNFDGEPLVEIYDMFGKKCAESKGQKSINTEHLLPGVYCIKIDGALQSTIIKQ